MNRPRAVRVLATSAAVALLATLGVGAPAVAQSAPSPTGSAPVLVARTGLAPLHLAVSSRGLYVPDAFLGTVTRLDLPARGATSTVVLARGLGFVPSVAARGSTLFVVRTAGQGGPQEQSPTFLSRVSRSGTPVDLVDLLALERRLNPDRQAAGLDAESNPYDVIKFRGGFLVADAAANAVFRVSASGRRSVFTALPLITTGPCAGRPNQGQVGCDSVPTGIAFGPDGFLYVSGLGSFVAGQVWKVSPRTGRVVARLTPPPGSPPLTDVAVAKDGSVYVSSIVAGRVFRLRAGRWTSVALPAPAGLVVARGTLYVGSAPAALLGEEPDAPAPTGPPPPGAVYAVPGGAFR